MKIHSLTATFGKLENQTLELKPGLNIIHAPNEWGKSTWCAFLAVMLYGLDTREKTTKNNLAVKERYAPWSGAPMAGRMNVNWNGRDITIERWTKGRTPLGEFRAYETVSGLAVPELTAANCGQTLLGVEKSVFLRAGYLRLTDLPVTEDEPLRRRLNALVTTGDESGEGDLLAQKLKDLKNKCRSNRANGLIPQAEMEKAALENKLADLRAARAQQIATQQRQKELEEQIADLENHKKVLEYAASEENNRLILQAELRRDEAMLRLEQLDAQCADLPDQETVQESVQKLRQLHQDSMALDLEQQMLPPAPQPPKDADSAFTLEQAQADKKRLEELVKANHTAQKIRHLGRLFLVASLIVLIAVRLLSNTWWIAAAASAIALLFSIFLLIRGTKGTQKQYTSICELSTAYGSLDTTAWIRQAEENSAIQAAYATALAEHEQILADFRAKQQTLSGKITELTQGNSISECLQHWESVAQKWTELDNARRVYENAVSHADAMAAIAKPVEKPTMPDNLNWSESVTAKLLADAAFEQKQLQIRLGQCQGRMDALGAESDLLAKLEAVNARLDKLRKTYLALELALATLEKATAELQRRFAPRIAQAAQSLFGKLTDGRYDRLQLQQDLSVNAAATGENVLHAAQWRSEGTIDQLYFALRLAVARELTPEAPLILDDALVRFDDTRHAAAMEILRQEAEQKQIILFTCQSREQ